MWLLLTRAGRAAANHGRSLLFPEGNRGFQFVKTGNCLAARVGLLLRYIAASKGRPVSARARIFFCVGRWLMEQPAGSALPHHPAVAKLFEDHKDSGACVSWLMPIHFACQVHSCGIWGGAYGDAGRCTPKRHAMWSNDRELVKRLHIASGHLSREQLDLFGGPPLTKKYRKPDGTAGYSGTPRLKQSQLHRCKHFFLVLWRARVPRTYPERLGAHLAALLREAQAPEWPAGPSTRCFSRCFLQVRLPLHVTQTCP